MPKQIFVVCFLALVTHKACLLHEERERGNVSEDRIKRSLFAAGKRASKTLLKNAKRVGKQGKQTIYMKQGGYQRAVDDFYSVKPTKVQNSKLPSQTFEKVSTVKGGKVGDRTITVMKRGRGEPTTLTITKSKDISLVPGTTFPTIMIFYYQ